MPFTRGTTSEGIPSSGIGLSALALRSTSSRASVSSRPSIRFMAQPTTIHESGMTIKRGAAASMAEVRASSFSNRALLRHLHRSKAVGRRVDTPAPITHGNVREALLRLPGNLNVRHRVVDREAGGVPYRHGKLVFAILICGRRHAFPQAFASVESDQALLAIEKIRTLRYFRSDRL